MEIVYRLNTEMSVEAFAALLQRSGLAARRPVDDTECLQGMLENSNLCLSAWHDDKLIGIARCVTDFHYACYLSDLAVDEFYQRYGIGKQLQKQVKKQLQPRCKLILIAAPEANDYYPKIGYSQNPRCWVLDADEELV